MKKVIFCLMFLNIIGLTYGSEIMEKDRLDKITLHCWTNSIYLITIHDDEGRIIGCREGSFKSIIHNFAVNGLKKNERPFIWDINTSLLKKLKKNSLLPENRIECEKLLVSIEYILSYRAAKEIIIKDRKKAESSKKIIIKVNKKKRGKKGVKIISTLNANALPFIPKNIKNK